MKFTLRYLLPGFLSIVLLSALVAGCGDKSESGAPPDRNHLPPPPSPPPPPGQVQGAKGPMPAPGKAK